MRKRYSKFIRPIVLLLDIFSINIILLFFFNNLQQDFLFNGYLIIFWFFSSIFSGYYKVYRFTSTYRLYTLFVSQAFIFILGFFAYFSIFKEGIIVNEQFNSLISIVVVLLILKFTISFLIKKYRNYGKNLRRVVFVEQNENTQNLIKLFNAKNSLGYNYVGFFANKKRQTSDFLGSISELFDFLENQYVNEVYVAQNKITRKELKEIKKFSSINNIVLKIVPDAKEFYGSKNQVQFYGNNLKVLSVKRLPFDSYENRFQKRIFDAFFSLITIVFILSWLTPILWVLIKLESKGPLFFKQKREGLNGDHFICYKFRSMKRNNGNTNTHTTKNDTRVTNIGKFLRKTSIDEFPQFFNVFLGDMSIVGPRPHMRSLAVEYEKDVENYMDRHAVKPGITGLAQVSGYRGEIKKKSDIKNRVRLDMFYIENWSIFLDIKIILQTIFSIFKGDEKAY